MGFLAVAAHSQRRSPGMLQHLQTARSRTSGEYLIGLPILHYLPTDRVSGERGAVQRISRFGAGSGYMFYGRAYPENDAVGWLFALRLHEERAMIRVSVSRVGEWSAAVGLQSDSIVDTPDSSDCGTTGLWVGSMNVQACCCGSVTDSPEHLNNEVGSAGPFP